MSVKNTTVASSVIEAETPSIADTVIPNVADAVTSDIAATVAPSVNFLIDSTATSALPPSVASADVSVEATERPRISVSPPSTDSSQQSAKDVIEREVKSSLTDEQIQRNMYSRHIQRFNSDIQDMTEKIERLESLSTNRFAVLHQGMEVLHNRMGGVENLLETIGAKMDALDKRFGDLGTNMTSAAQHVVAVETKLQNESEKLRTARNDLIDRTGAIKASIEELTGSVSAKQQVPARTIPPLPATNSPGKALPTSPESVLPKTDPRGVAPVPTTLPPKPIVHTHRCGICGAGFTDHADYIKHTQTGHIAPPPRPVPTGPAIAPFQVTSPSAFARQRQMAAGRSRQSPSSRGRGKGRKSNRPKKPPITENAPLTCRKCDRVFANPEAIKMHFAAAGHNRGASYDPPPQRTTTSTSPKDPKLEPKVAAVVKPEPRAAVIENLIDI